MTARVPPMVPAPSTVAMELVRLAAPVPVLSETAPVKAFDALVSVSAPVPEVVKDAVPPTVRAPVWVIAVLVVESTTVRLPPTLDVPNTSAPARVRLALPEAPVVLSVTAPVSALAEFSVIVAFEADVVKDDVPVTVSRPVWVRLPVLSTIVRLPVAVTPVSPFTVPIESAPELPNDIDVPDSATVATGFADAKVIVEADEAARPPVPPATEIVNAPSLIVPVPVLASSRLPTLARVTEEPTVMLPVAPPDVLPITNVPAVMLVNDVWLRLSVPPDPRPIVALAVFGRIATV